MRYVERWNGINASCRISATEKGVRGMGSIIVMFSASGISSYPARNALGGSMSQLKDQ